MIREFPYDAHVHTSLGLGGGTPAECVRAAEAASLAALALTDHYDAEESQIPARWEAYRRAADRSRVHVIAGAECDILDPTGRLTLSEAAGQHFPLVLARLSSLTQGIARDTPVRLEVLLRNLRSALVAACRRPHVNVLAVPFNLGRFPAALTPAQSPASLLEEVAGVMREEEVAFELAASVWTWYPDLPAREFLAEYAHLVMTFAREGVKFVVGSDARWPEGVGNMRFVERLTAAAGVEKSQLVDLSRLPGVAESRAGAPG